MSSPFPPTSLPLSKSVSNVEVVPNLEHLTNHLPNKNKVIHQELHVDESKKNELLPLSVNDGIINIAKATAVAKPGYELELKNDVSSNLVRNVERANEFKRAKKEEQKEERKEDFGEQDRERDASVLTSEQSVDDQSTEPKDSKPSKQTKEVGRKKIKIELIRDPRSRQVTFLKRKNGLMKKAMELSVLCDCEVGVIVYNKNNGKMFEYSSDPMEQTLYRYATYNGPFERRKTEKFFDLAGSKTNSNIPLNEPHLAQAAIDAASAASNRPRPHHNFDSITSGGEVQVGTKRPAPSDSFSPNRRVRAFQRQNVDPRYLANNNIAQASLRPQQNSMRLPSPMLSQASSVHPVLPCSEPSVSQQRYVPPVPLPHASITPRTAGKQISSFLGLPETPAVAQHHKAEHSYEDLMRIQKQQQQRAQQIQEYNWRQFEENRWKEQRQYFHEGQVQDHNKQFYMENMVPQNIAPQNMKRQMPPTSQVDRSLDPIINNVQDIPRRGPVDRQALAYQQHRYLQPKVEPTTGAHDPDRISFDQQRQSTREYEQINTVAPMKMSNHPSQSHILSQTISYQAEPSRFTTNSISKDITTMDTGGNTSLGQVRNDENEGERNPGTTLPPIAPNSRVHQEPIPASSNSKGAPPCLHINDGQSGLPQSLSNPNSNSNSSSLPTPTTLTNFLNMDLITPRDGQADPNRPFFTPRGMGFDTLLSSSSGQSNENMNVFKSDTRNLLNE